MEIKIFLELAIILIAAKIFGLFTRKIHLPQVVGALLAGIVLGPAVLNIVEKSEMITNLAEIGVLLLMFSGGMETDLKGLRSSWKSSFVIAVFGVVLPLASGFALAFLFGQDLMRSIFIGLILTATSISITIEVLHEMGKLKTKVGTAILGAAVIDDILGVIILSFIIGGGGGIISAGFMVLLLKICGFFAVAIIGGYGVYKLFEVLSVKFGNTRRLPIFGLGLCFLLAYAAERLGVADITGAYIAGLVFSNSRAEKYIEEKNYILSYMFFSPVFFISVGLMTSFDGFTGETVLFAFLLLIAAVVSKLFGCGLGALLFKFTGKEAVQIGTGMISRGEVAIIVATKGMTAGLMEPRLFSSIIIVVILTTLIAPILIKFAFLEK